MRIKDSAIRAAAETLRPYLSDVIREKGVIIDADIKQAIKDALADGLIVPRLVSARSLAMVEETITSM